MLNIKRGLSFALISIVVVASASCYKYRAEDYETQQFFINNSWKMTLVLHGTDVMRGHNAFRGSPYELSIIASASGEFRGNLIVSGIELVPSNSSDDTVTIPGIFTDALTKSKYIPSTEPFTPRSIAGIAVDKLDIPFLDYRLRCHIEIRTESETVVEDIDQPFGRVPKEWRSNSWLDAISSV